MSENIKYYPTSYIMSAELKSFFTAVTNDKKLQEKLYLTDKVSDVAIIANNLGFDINAAEIIQAQAGRVLAILDEKSDDVQNLISGKKPKTGAQWGRGGGGFLDRAGYWLNELSSATAITAIETQINQFLDKVNSDSDLKKKLIDSKTFNDVALLAKENDFDLNAINLLSHQAKKILALSEVQAEALANN